MKQSKQMGAVRQTVRAVYKVRRPLGTILVIAVAVVFAYTAVFGHDGIIAYAQKRTEDKVLKTEIDRLNNENGRLQDRVQHLKDDPDTIEGEARQRLHYTRPGEVIYTLNGASRYGAHK